MKINFIIPFRNVTGGLRVVFELSNELTSMGHEVRVIYPVFPIRTTFGIRGLVEVITKGFANLFMKISWYHLDADTVPIPSLSLRFVSFTQKLLPNADVTIATQRSTAYFVDKLNKNKGKKVYFIQHYEIWPLWGDEDSWKEAMKINNDKPSLGMAHVKPKNKNLKEAKHYVDTSFLLNLSKITTSSWENDIMKELSVKIHGSIPYGVNFEMFYPETQKSQPLPGGQKCINILALYRSSNLRGDSETIKAFIDLSKKHKNLEFYMFGEKSDSRIPDFIHFFENPSQEQIRKLYQQADIFVYASWVEGYGMPPMEALACETALISTDVGAVRDYTDESCVIFIPIKDSKAIMENVELLISNPEKLRNMKKNGYQCIKNFTWEQASLKFESLLIELIS